MPTVNMHEAKTGLSKLVAEIESGAEQEIIIARNGKPVARLVSIEQPIKKPRLLGIAEGLFEFDYEEFQALDKVVQDQFAASIERDEEVLRQRAKRKRSA
jgi:prevent-host-death family protein